MSAIHTRITPLLASIAVAILCMAALPPSPPTTDFVDITKTAPKALPALSFQDADGNSVKLDTSKHKLTALHLWATWCVPCRDELPVVDETLQAYADKGLQVIAISMDGKNIAKVKDFFDEHEIENLKPYLDPANALFKATGARGLPSTIFINGKGQEIARAQGPLDWEDEMTVKFLQEQLK